MPDINTNEMPESDEERRVRTWKKPPSSFYDITNPLVHRRVIFDCLGAKNGGKAIGIDPGQTLANVELADHVASKLLAQDDDLKLVPVASDKPTLGLPKKSAA